MDGQWLKITRNLFDSSCDTIRTRILKNMDTVNLNDISVQLHRMGGQDWAQVNTAEALMSFTPDPTWTQQQLEANIKVTFFPCPPMLHQHTFSKFSFGNAGPRASLHREAFCLHG